MVNSQVITIDTKRSFKTTRKNVIDRVDGVMKKYNSEMEIKSERIDYIDTVKALLIILVVWGHISIILNPKYDKISYTVLQSIIYTFHMQSFFMIHGILFKADKWRNLAFVQYFKKKIFTLFVPYLFFESVGMLWKFLLCSQSINDGLYYLATIRCNVGADWFLPAMFMGDILFWFFTVKLERRLYVGMSILGCFIFPVLFPNEQIFIVSGRAMLAYAFTMLGYFLKYFFLSQKFRRWSVIILACVVTLISSIYSIKVGANDLYSCTINNPIILIAGGISGTILIFGISSILRYKALNYIGRYTLIIMGTHQLVIYLLTVLFPSLYGGNIMDGLIILGAIVSFEIPVCWVLKRYLPYCVGIKQQ